MQHTLKITATVTACLFLFSCGSAPDQQAISKADAAMVSAEAVGDESTIGTDIRSESRKIIKTADFKARVRNVYEVTHSLEQQVNSLNGLVMESVMENTSTGMRHLPYPGDSLRQVQSYTTISHLTVRIPVKLVDSFMSIVAASAAFIDSRNLKLNDMTLQYLGNHLRIILTSTKIVQRLWQREQEM